MKPLTDLSYVDLFDRVVNKGQVLTDIVDRYKLYSIVLSIQQRYTDDRIRQIESVLTTLPLTYHYNNIYLEGHYIGKLKYEATSVKFTFLGDYRISFDFTNPKLDEFLRFLQRHSKYSTYHDEILNDIRDWITKHGT